MVLVRFCNPLGLDIRVFWFYFDKEDSWLSLFLFPFETCEQGIFFFESSAVNLFPVKIVARAFD